MAVSLRNWIDQHQRAARESIGNVLMHPMASGMTAAVLAIALLLPLLLWVLVLNLQHIVDVQPTQEMYVFMQADLTATQVQENVTALQQHPDIADIHRISPDEGMRRLQSNTGFDGVSDLLENNPLPWVLIVIPAADRPETVERLTVDIQNQSGVQLVQSDLGWLRQLRLVLSLAVRGLLVLVAVFAVSTLLIISNTIRMDIDNRRAEIEIMSLIGAAPGYVRRVFLYTGCLYGSIAGLVAIVSVLGICRLMSSPYQALASNMRFEAVLQVPGGFTLLIALAAGGVLGWLGAFLSVGQYLRRHRRG